jgi:N6-L-threonylcarbamoyladenine synthase
MIVGIDTSCYTTSVAAVDATGRILFEHRKLLRVKPGEKGLRQSEAVFQHIRQLPDLWDDDFTQTPIDAVVAANIPRPTAGSYLPVFTVGAAFGKTWAKLCGAPFIATSHQEGHLRAGWYGRTPPERPYLAWHISGGTSELLEVTPARDGSAVRRVGGSTDLHVGQFVDRIGLALGGPFPAGPFLEELALRASAATGALPVAIRGTDLSFSGPATAAERLIRQGVTGPEVAQQVFACIGQSIWRATLEAVAVYQLEQVLFVGGVSSNRLVRRFLQEAAVPAGLEVAFAPTELSSDNAVGVALVGYDRVNGD